MSYLSYIFQNNLHMKSISIFITGLLLAGYTCAQSCLPDGIEFTTQGQVDSFQVNYPGCVRIEGDVLIAGSTITNLNGLSALTSFGGDLHIASQGLTGLTGLNAVTSIDGKLMINDTPLSSLDGLQSLTTIGGDLMIIYMNGLVSLSGIQSITSVSGTFSISSSNNLASLADLSALTEIGGGLELEALISLSSLTGLESLTSIGGPLTITSVGLTDLTGLNSLTTIGGGLTVRNSHGITSLTGMDQLAGSSITSLTITNNDILSECAVQPVCAFLAAPGGTVEIHDNATGCESQQEVTDSCAAIGVPGISEFRPLTVYPNPGNGNIFLGNLPTGATGLFRAEMMTIQGQTVFSCFLTCEQPVFDPPLAAGVYILKVLLGDRIFTNLIIRE